jgi:hypothetical protein
MKEIVKNYKDKGFKLMYDQSRGSLNENVKLPLNPSAVVYNDQELLTLLEYLDFDADMIEARCDDFIKNCWIPYDKNYYHNNDYFNACLKLFGEEVGKAIINILFDIKIRACISQLYLIQNVIGEEWMYCKNCIYKTAIVFDSHIKNTMEKAIKNIYLSIFTKNTYHDEILFEDIENKTLLIINNETLFRITAPAKFGKKSGILNNSGFVKLKFKDNAIENYEKIKQKIAKCFFKK